MFATFCLAASICLGAPPGAMVEVTFAEGKTPARTITGRIVTADSEACWLLCRDGRQELIHHNTVKKHRELPGRFLPYSSADLRDILLREFGKSYEVRGTPHYLVCSEAGNAASYGAAMEQLYRQFSTFFSARNFRLKEPEFPLVALVFPSQSKFHDYCRSEGVQPQTNLAGYYLQTSNRIAMYLDPEAGTTADALGATILHEATHQLAFNMGVHPRMGTTPQWVVEGLATAFEAEGMRYGGGQRATSEKLNRERYVWFKGYARDRRKKNFLSDFIQSDQLYKSATLDAYSEGWALTYFLMETRPAEYTAYMKHLAARPSFTEYTAAERTADFQKAFGKDLKMLDTDYLRYMNRITP